MKTNVQYRLRIVSNKDPRWLVNFDEEVIIEDESQPAYPETKEIQENVSSPKLEKLRRIVYLSSFVFLECRWNSRWCASLLVKSQWFQLITTLPLDGNLHRSSSSVLLSRHVPNPNPEPKIRCQILLDSNGFDSKRFEFENVWIRQDSNSKMFGFDKIRIRKCLDSTNSRFVKVRDS